ncbi:MAG: hypothetical protein WBV35_07245, partial [Steroidobacteraceae bacterium]
MFNPHRGGAVLLPSGPPKDVTRKHLFVLLTDPHGPGKRVLMAPICSVPKDTPYDDTCLIAAAEHPFIKHDSYVPYSRCRDESVVDLQKHAERGYLTEMDPASAALLQRIIAGLSKSKFARPYARSFLRDFEALQKSQK